MRATMNVLVDFWEWWRGELRSLLPASLREDGAEATVSIHRDQCIIYRKRDGSRETLERAGPETLGRHIREFTGASSCNILLAEGRFLTRPLSENRLPSSRADAMASIDVEETTPLSIEDVYICLEDARYDQSDTDYFAIKKSVLDPVLDGLAAAGVRPSSIRVMDGAVERKLCRRSLARIGPTFSKASWSRRFVQGAACFLAITVLVTCGHIYFRYAEARERLAAQVEERQGQAVSVRKAMDERRAKLARLDSARMSKAQAVPVVRVWEELTSIIPDGSWITDLAIKSDEVTIVGYSPVAAELISSIEASSLFQSTNFDAPVTKVPGQSGERFVIRTVIAR